MFTGLDYLKNPRFLSTRGQFPSKSTANGLNWGTVMLRILLIVDHAVVRRGVKHILAVAFAQAAFGQAQNVHELLKSIGSERWDIVVFD
jgi:hypothetical protein